MFNIFKVLSDGALLSVLVFSMVLISTRINPRIFLHTYPKDIQDKVAANTQNEKLLSRIIGVTILILVTAVPLISSWSLKQRQHADVSFLPLFLNAFGVVFLFNLADLLLDCVLVCTLPKFLVLQGTEGMAGYKNYLHHFRGFLIGTIASVVLGLAVAAVAFVL
ncbi:MAG TPA: hypothetical protein VGP68_17515 [Gemmataceae bacterium]|jgi:hypothetical protein|nr:hypothetical protein [Gemmataceae bacterium]